MTVKPYNTGQTKKEEVREMFDNIAPKYDLLNHTLSMNIDRIWRRRVVRIVRRSRPHRILDVATGTGDLAIEMARHIRDVHVLGVDLSEKMLDVARCKVAARGLDERVVLDVGDAEHLRVSDASVDVVTVAFGVRNFGDLEAGLREMARTIKPGGKVVILEFSRPRNRAFRALYEFYSYKILPRIGSLIESPGFYPNLTGTENLRIFATLRGVPNNHAIKDALDLVGLPYKDKKLFSQYSLGMKQRLAIALAVMHDPELFILDEPINGLDPIGIAEVRSFIRELCDARGKTIFISSHILSEIALLADDIGIIDHGVLLEEESLAELAQKSGRYVLFTLSDTAQAAKILERAFPGIRFSIQDSHTLRLHDPALPAGKMVTAFVEHGLEVSEAHTCEESLEDYFKRVTGGEGIA